MVSFHGRDPLDGIGSLASALGSTSHQATGFTCLVAQGAWGLAEDCCLTANTQSTMRKPELRTKKKKKKKKKKKPEQEESEYACYPQCRRLRNFRLPFRGQSISTPCSWKDLNTTKFFGLSLLCLGSFGVWGILESVKYHCVVM